ncbi:uroporphyrinogen-III C-methyltransferase [Pedobacter sp. LMG 31464]|uniref:uroporphyrinogen-III C-methyltransferase n=1 Tax=Pedobacter planticolens TaxID=2679964 RepID=A0A923IT52_9SPHI|nr:uroporphyrinogen-III C-methyltransferase [Pedobacter planticolens]MBB2144330.1 uroporphyrinogen-III C-methyltransferase [Pedobacter planticolens]
MIVKQLEKTIIEPKITLVGAGPGDPDLLTLKGVKALNTANVVLYDALVNEALLNYAPENAIKVYVGKRSGDESFSQELVNKLMIDYALNYGHVVRLKSGDPFVFARGYEEIDVAESYSIPTEIVPGVSSALGVPGLQKIPMVYGTLSESFWVVTGTNAAGEISQDLHVAAKSNATIVVLMGVEKIKEIASIFKAEGKANLPVAVIENGSSAKENVVVGVVETIEELIIEKNISSPALLVFGNVVSLHPQFNAIKEFYAILEREEY